MSDGMVSVAEARARAEKAVNRGRREWAARGIGTATVLSIPLKPPTERTALRHQSAALQWVDAWRSIDDAEVEWVVKHWSSAGSQRVPVRCTLHGADAITKFAGPQIFRSWRLLRDRTAALRDQFGDDEPLSAAVLKHGTTIERLDEQDFILLLQTLEWLRQHPASGYWLRQLPVPGLHTKWLGARRALVEALHSAVTGAPELGLRSPPERARLRFLDPAQRPGGIVDITAPVDELARLDTSPSTVFVFENLESVLAMPDWPGAVAVHGGGYALTLQHIPWVRHARLVYWGDIDADGFAILNRLRSNALEATSVLMDASTLRRYRHLSVPDPNGTARRTLPHLSDAEREAYDLTAELGGLRLEQERLPWSAVLEELRAASAAQNHRPEHH